MAVCLSCFCFFKGSPVENAEPTLHFILTAPNGRMEIFMNIYLDHAATTPLSPPMQQYLSSLLHDFGNPSSLYSLGLHTKSIIENARRNTAAFIHASRQDVFFTGGGSASNTLAIKGYCSRHDCNIFYSPLAHKSILKCAASCKKSRPLKVDKKGFLDLNDLEKQLYEQSKTPFVIIEYANSEIGTIQPVDEIIQIVHRHKGIIYIDCTGSIPSIPFDVKNTDVDMCGFSAHKLGALKGCGVFYKKSSIDIEPLIYGAQEQGLWGGTENVLGIASLGKALEHYDYSFVSSKNRDYVYDFIRTSIPGAYLVGSLTNRLPHHLYICFQGIEGEALMMLLDMKGIQVSTGSACNAKNLSASDALSAIGMNEKDIHSCIRITFSGRETKEELDYFCRNLKESVNRLKSMNKIKYPYKQHKADL